MAYLLNLLILNQSDDQQTFMDKVNYNFDQILAMGGGPPGFQGFQGIQGIPGNQGIHGIQGIPGTPGSVWFVTATSTPPLGTPAVNDYWFDTSTLNIYQWDGSSWVYLSSLSTTNVFKMASFGGSEIQYANPTGRKLVLSDIDYSLVGDSQPAPFQLKVISDSGDASITFGLNETPSIDTTAEGETLNIFQNTIVVSKENATSNYEWAFFNPTYNTWFSNTYTGGGSNTFHINVYDESPAYGFGTPASTFWFNGSGGLIFDLTPTAPVYNKRIEYAQALTAHPTNNESLHFSTMGPQGSAIDNVTFTDYAYVGLSKTDPHYKLDINGGTLGNNAGDVVSLLRLYTNEGSFGTTDKSSSLGISAVKLETGATNRSAIRITHFAAQNILGVNVRRPSSYIQFSDENNSGYNIGLMRFGVDQNVGSTTYDNEGDIAMREEYFYGHDRDGRSAFGIVNNTSPSGYNFVKYYGDNYQSWPATVNIQSSVFPGEELTMQSIDDTVGAIHLYQPDLDPVEPVSPQFVNYSYTGISTGGFDGNGGGMRRTTAALLFQGDDGDDGTKVHLMSSAYGDTTLSRRLSVRGEGQTLIWSRDQSTSNPHAATDYALMIDVRDHSGGGVSANSTAIIRNMRIPTASFNGNSVASTDRAIIFQPNAEGFVGIGGKVAGSAFGANNDTPQTKFHVDGAVTIGTRKTITTYSSEVGLYSLTHGGNLKNAGHFSAIISGTDHDILQGAGFPFGFNTVIGTQLTQLTEGGQGLTIDPPLTIVPTTTVATVMSILPAPVDMNVQANNKPVFQSSNSYYGSKFNALTVTLPLDTQVFQSASADYRSNGIEVERWIDSATAYTDAAYIPLHISVLDKAAFAPIYMNQYQTAGSSVPTLVVDHTGRTAINTVPFSTFASEGLISGIGPRATTDFRYVASDASLHVGPAPFVQNGHYVPDAYMPGVGQSGAGSIVISARNTLDNNVFDSIVHGAVYGGFVPNARIQTSGIRRDTNSEIWGAPFEIFPGKVLNLDAGILAKAHGSILRITGGEAGALGSDSYGGALLLRGGFGNYGGYVEVKGGAGSGAPGGSVYIDSADSTSSTNIGRDKDGTLSGGDVNIDGTTITVTGKLRHTAAPANVPTMLPVLAGGGGVTASAGYMQWYQNSAGDKPQLATWDIISPAVDYDRFINTRTSLGGSGGQTTWGMWNIGFSVDASVLITSATMYFSNDSASGDPHIDNLSNFTDHVVAQSFFVPAGMPIYAQHFFFDRFASGTNWTATMTIVETKMGR